MEEKLADVVEEISVIGDKESNLVPSMNINASQEVEKDNIIKDDVLLKVYEEILGDLRNDRDEVSDLLNNMVDMVVNDGDATTASKEALVNLMKIKTDIADKKAKIADLMTRVKLKERDTFPRYLAAKQENNIKIEAPNKRRKEIMKLIQEVKEEKNAGGS